MKQFPVGLICVTKIPMISFALYLSVHVQTIWKTRKKNKKPIVTATCILKKEEEAKEARVLVTTQLWIVSGVDVCYCLVLIHTYSCTVCDGSRRVVVILWMFGWVIQYMQSKLRFLMIVALLFVYVFLYVVVTVVVACVVMYSSSPVTFFSFFLVQSLQPKHLCMEYWI